MSTVTRVIRPTSRPLQTARIGERDRDNPTLFEAMAVDANLHVTPDSLALQVRNLQRGHRRHLRPIVKILCMFVIRCTLFVKRMLPFDVSSEHVLNWLGPRFLRRFCSPETLEMVLRHFVVESNLVNFIARNSGGLDVHEVSLFPTCANDLADDHGVNAIVRHDANIFNLVIDLGESETADVHATRPFHELDFSMLAIPEFDLELDVERWLNLDLETSLHITVAVLALLIDFRTAERAVNSFQLDESVLASIATLTGDVTYRTWTPIKYGNWLGMTNDVGRDLHWHMIVTEYAHTRLLWARDSGSACA